MQAKEQLIQAVKAKLANIIDAGAAEKVIDIVAVELKDYDLTKRSTELIVYDDENQKVIKSFLGCLLVEGKSKSTITQYRYSLQRLFKFLGNRLRHHIASM